MESSPLAEGFRTPAPQPACEPGVTVTRGRPRRHHSAPCLRGRAGTQAPSSPGCAHRAEQAWPAAPRGPSEGVDGPVARLSSRWARDRPPAMDGLGSVAPTVFVELRCHTRPSGLERGSMLPVSLARNRQETLRNRLVTRTVCLSRSSCPFGRRVDPVEVGPTALAFAVAVERGRGHPCYCRSPSLGSSLGLFSVLSLLSPLCVQSSHQQGPFL